MRVGIPLAPVKDDRLRAAHALISDEAVVLAIGAVVAIHQLLSAILVASVRRTWRAAGGRGATSSSPMTASSESAR